MVNNKEKYIDECNGIKVTGEFKRETAEKMRARLKQKEHAGHRTLRWAVPAAAAAVLLCAFTVFSVLRPAAVSAKENLMEGITARPVKAIAKEGERADFIKAQADFSINIFKNTVKEGKNSLVSPASISLALGMTANGAEGETLKQFEVILGGGMDIGSLNRQLGWENAAFKSLKDGRLDIANSIWYDNEKNLSVKKDFLQKNADYFGAGAFQLDFSDSGTLQKINSWVKSSTGGKIDKVINNISPNDVMYIINAVYFEQDWMKSYSSSMKGIFHTRGKDVTADYLRSAEVYMHDGESEGILKPLEGGKYSFAAFMPSESTEDIDAYIKNMTGAKYTGLVKPAEKILSQYGNGGKTQENYDEDFAASSLPKFKYDFSASLKDALGAMGLTDAFDTGKADFGGMGKSDKGNIFVSDVMHKTFIQVNELGVEAAAATAVIDAAGSSAPPKNTVTFDRPFVYAIVDNETCLPLFIGKVENPQA